MVYLKKNIFIVLKFTVARWQGIYFLYSRVYNRSKLFNNQSSEGETFPVDTSPTKNLEEDEAKAT